MDVFHFFLLCVASFRLTRLIVYDRITSFLRAPFHDEFEQDGEMYIVIKGTGIRKWIGELFSCHWCTGIWCAAGLYVGTVYAPSIFMPLVSILAIAGGAALMETVVQKWSK
ncbi:DUF1360 domain-containing protein [Anoxybacillus flavithermus]|uniref:Uncharacterized conserved protein n=1 Tax=Anoxybacillus flavithermus (strain DSM 21510 / WK1) TaxID=491915 RepID=B7GLQ1_ANOFW|nr:DUF1360 domain-containing protein [Anoxybacillus flavithermus]ACJ34452.1 Uncharacterized conserved protein [Anoxybacillus flavithermus WK1]AXM88229.1 DUF1360 domain-containing protein [Anoxybacillus ayderensis G10]